MNLWRNTLLGLAIVTLALPALGLAASITHFADMDGSKEPVPNSSPGTGFATVTIDLQARTLSVDVTFKDLEAPAVAAHIHGPTAIPGEGAAQVMTTTPTFPGFPLATSGLYQQTFDTSLASTWNPAFITANGGTVEGAEAAFAAAFANGQTYFNIHSQKYPGGEIRGFLVAPVPASILLFGTGMLLLGARRLRRKTS